MNKILIPFLLVLLYGTAHAQLPAYLPAAGLIAWWPFTGNVIDSSGDGHDGTLFGPTLTTGRYGVPNTAYYFNGTSDYIYIPPGSPGHETSTDIVNSLTISAWVKSSNYFYSPTGQEQIYWRGDATPAHDPHMLYINGGEIRIRRDVDPGTISNEVGTSIGSLDTSFHLLTGTYDSATSTYKIYVDGVLENTSVLAGMETYPTSTMYNLIGAVDSGTWQFFYGTMDEIGIWNRALTPCEVAGLYYSLPNIITHQPVNDTVNVAGTATFTITDVVPGSTYQWQENSGTGFVNLTSTAPYSGVNTPTLTISPVTSTLSGHLYRCIPNSGTCLTDTSYAGKLVIRNTTGIEDPHYSNVAIIPNPSNGSFTIKGSFTGDNDVSVEIIDMLGKVIFSGSATLQSGQLNKQVVLDNREGRGMYFLKIHSQNESKVLPLVIGN